MEDNDLLFYIVNIMAPDDLATQEARGLFY